ncbi:MAG: cation:proton antiporter [Verrucomicrobiales bacterium]
MPPLFALLAIIAVAVVLVSLLLLRFRQSLLLGYFLCGVVIANSGILGQFGGGESEGHVQNMAEFGVILLMFTVGLEFSLGELRYLRRFAFWGGLAQMALTVLPIAVLGKIFGLTWAAAVSLGVALAASSTAVGMKAFQERSTATTPGARLALGVAIFQDLLVIAFVVMMPVIFSGSRNNSLMPAVIAVAVQGVAFVAIAAALARWFIPRLLDAVARSRNRELFTLTVFGVCVGIAFLSGLMQLSLAMGAFVAGVTLSESIYRHRILTDVLPLKDLFLTLFFVSVGLMIDVPTALANAHLVIALTLALMIFKGGLVALIGKFLGVPFRAALLGAASISSAGEFSLLVLQRGGQFQKWPAVAEQVWLSSIAISMALVPLAMGLATPVGATLARWFASKKPGALPAALKASERVKTLRDHAVVCGYGPVGRALVKALATQGVPSLVVELNADTVRLLHRAGQPVLFADAAHRETWELAQMKDCRLVAFTFPDTEVVAAALPLVRDKHPEVLVLARTKFASDTARLRSFGVDIIIHDEVETARAAVREALAVFERPAAD